jgi:hypothetical protein
MMGWAAGFFDGGSSMLVVGCLVGMGLLMWLLLRLTAQSPPRVGVRRPNRVLADQRSEGSTDPNAYAWTRRRIDAQAPSGPAGSGSVAP